MIHLRMIYGNGIVVGLSVDIKMTDLKINGTKVRASHILGN